MAVAGALYYLEVRNIQVGGAIYVDEFKAWLDRRVIFIHHRRNTIINKGSMNNGKIFYYLGSRPE